MFEPFFTTEAAAEGTGLGLPIASEIVQDWGSARWVKMGQLRAHTEFLTASGGHCDVRTAPGTIHAWSVRLMLCMDSFVCSLLSRHLSPGESELHIVARASERQ